MSYPNRTYSEVTLPGSTRQTRFLSYPVNGGSEGADAQDKIRYIETFSAIENTGVGHVLQEPPSTPLTDEQIIDLIDPQVAFRDSSWEPIEGDEFTAGDTFTAVFYFDLTQVPGITGATVQIIEDETGLTNFERWEYSTEEGYEGDYAFASSWTIFGSGFPDPNTTDVTSVPATTNGAAGYIIGDGPNAGTREITIEWTFDQLSEPYRQTATLVFTAP